MATLTPFEGTTLAGYYSLEKDAKRMEVNTFIRTAPSSTGSSTSSTRSPIPPTRCGCSRPTTAATTCIPTTPAKPHANAITWLDDPSLPISSPATVGAAVPATLSLTLGAAPSSAPSSRASTREYSASTKATVTSTAGDATLTICDPGRLSNGSFSLAQPLQVTIAPNTWNGPVSNGVAALSFAQAIDANEPLRTGTYGKTLVLTLATTAP